MSSSFLRELGDQPLPPALQHALQRAGRLDVLAQNHFLADEVFDALVTRRPLPATTFLSANLTAARARRAFAALTGDSFASDAAASDAGWELAAALEAMETLSRRTVTHVLRTALPLPAAALLERALRAGPALTAPLDLPTLHAAAHLAPRGPRARWCASPLADALGDDEVFALLSAPETLPEHVAGTIYHADTLTSAILHSALVLHLRPALRRRAAASDDRVLLLAAARTWLDADEQALLVASQARSWEGPGLDELVRLASPPAYDRSRLLDPAALVAASPWASEDTLAFVGADPHSSVVLDGERVLRRDMLNDRHHHLLLDPALTPRLEPDRTAPVNPEHAAAHLRAQLVSSSRAYLSPLTVLELGPHLARGHASRRSRRLCRDLLTHAPELTTMLRRRGELLAVLPSPPATSSGARRADPYALTLTPSVDPRVARLTPLELSAEVAPMLFCGLLVPHLAEELHSDEEYDALVALLGTDPQLSVEELVTLVRAL